MNGRPPGFSRELPEFDSWPFLALALEQGSDVRGRPHTQTLSYPLQRHRGLAPQTRGDSNLLRVTLAATLETRRGPRPGRHHDYIDPQDFQEGWLKLRLTVEVEAKAKELAVRKLRVALLARARFIP
jgi:hypothetical protein